MTVLEEGFCLEEGNFFAKVDWHLELSVASSRLIMFVLIAK